MGVARDGSAPALIRFAHPADRRRFLRAAAVVGIGASLAGFGAGADPAAAQVGQKASEATLLQYGLTFEYLMCDLYERGLQSGLLDGREEEIVDRIYRQELANISMLTDLIVVTGERPVRKPSFHFPEPMLTSREGWLSGVSELEELGVSAWNGQYQILRTPEYVAMTGPVMVNKCFAASVIAALAGRNPFPDVVVRPATIVEVLAQVEGYRGAGR